MNKLAALAIVASLVPSQASAFGCFNRSMTNGVDFKVYGIGEAMGILIGIFGEDQINRKIEGGMLVLSRGGQVLMIEDRPGDMLCVEWATVSEEVFEKAANKVFGSEL